MIAAITGHRKLGQDYGKNPVYLKVFDKLKETLLQIRPETVLSGMALGSDQLCCEVCIQLQIPFIAVVPFEGQERVWPHKSKLYYQGLLSQATEIKIVSEGGYAPWKMQARNNYIVDNCDLLIAIFKATETSGGTFNCINYAKSIGRKIIYIDPDF